MQKDTLCYCTSNGRQKVSRKRGQKLSSLDWVSNLSLQLLLEKPRICCQEHPKWLLAQCLPQQLQQITHGNAFDIYSAPWKDLQKCHFLICHDLSQFSHLGRIVRGPIPHQISNSPFKEFQFVTRTVTRVTQYVIIWIQYVFLHLCHQNVCHFLYFCCEVCRSKFSWWHSQAAFRVLVANDLTDGRFPDEKHLARWQSRKDFSTTLAAKQSSHGVTEIWQIWIN